RHVGHPDMHGHVAEPREESHMPEGELTLAFKRNASPDLGFRYRPEVGQGSDTQFRKDGHSRSNKNHDHPGCGQVGEPCHLVKAEHGNHCSNSAYNQDGEDPSHVIGIDIVQCWHGKIEWYSYGGSADGDHGSCQKAEQAGIDEVVAERKVLPSYFFKLIVKRNAFSHRDLCREVSPTQHGEKVSYQKSPNQVGCRHAVCDE